MSLYRNESEVLAPRDFDKVGMSKDLEIINSLLESEAGHKKQTWQPLEASKAAEVTSATSETTKDNLKSIERYMLNLISLASHVTLEANESFELEGRLGSFDRVAGIFRPGVSKEFMDRCIAVFNHWDGWAEVSSWCQTEDTYYEANGKPYRTTTDYSSNPPAISHMIKEKVATADFVSQTTQGAQVNDLYDLRVCLSKEKMVPAPAVNVVMPSRVRVKIRKSFAYKPEGCDEAHWRFDFTMAWQGKDIVEADRKQAEADDTTYEVEVECTNPHIYLVAASVTASYLAASIILKVKNDLLRWGSWRPSSFQSSTRAKHTLSPLSLDIFFRIVQTKTYVDV